LRFLEDESDVTFSYIAGYPLDTRKKEAIVSDHLKGESERRGD